MHYYTYLLIHPITELKYIGVRSCKCLPENDPYMGSSRAMSSSYKKEFDKLVIQEFPTKAQAIAHEIALHKQFNVSKNPEFLNIANATAGGFTIYEMSEAHKMKLLKGKLGVPRTPETIAKLKLASQKRYAEGRGVPLSSYKRGEEHSARKYRSTYRWANIDGTEFIGTNLDMKDYLGVKHIQTITKLVRGLNAQLNGWYTVENLSTGICTSDLLYVTKRTWKNTTTEGHFFGTGAQLSKAYQEVTVSGVNKVLRKDRVSTNGWVLVD
jgi:hypothetical protein